MLQVTENSHIFNPEAGRFINTNHQRIAEIIHDYDGSLELAWIPPETRDATDTQPFAIICKPTGGKPYVVRKCKEEDVNESLIAWLWSNDQARGGQDLMGKLEAMDAAKQAIKLHAEMEQREQAIDFTKAVVGSHLNTYRHNGVKYQ